ncbi:MAG: hypothetical protein HYY85_05765, partial [Deltaproteobacteria bacterium]|nr:hypothetical protein [Deltaproteobacteria bacterium]
MKSVRAFCLRGGWIGRLATVSLGLLTAATWLLPPGAAGAANLYDSAKKEGKVVVYTYNPIPILQVLLQEFEKQYPGVKTEYYRARGNQVLNRFLDESRVGKHVADVLILSGEQTHVMAQKKLLAKYQSPECASYPAT